MFLVMLFPTIVISLYFFAILYNFIQTFNIIDVHDK